MPRPKTITVEGSSDLVNARDSKLSDFSHGFSRIGIDNQAPMLFEVDQRHLLELVKRFNDSLLDGEFLLLRTLGNPTGAGAASPQRHGGGHRGGAGGGVANSTALYRQGGAAFLMKASAELARANMLNQANGGSNTPSLSGADGVSRSGTPQPLPSVHQSSPLMDRYSPSEIQEQLCGLPPAAAVSMRFRLSPWRSLFEKWIAGMLEERRPEPKGLSKASGGASSARGLATATRHGDLAWESVRPSRVLSKNVDPVLQLELLIQCAFRVADLHALAEEVPSVNQPIVFSVPRSANAQPPLNLGASQAYSRSAGPSSYISGGGVSGLGGTPRQESLSIAATPRQMAVQQKALVYDRMIRPPRGVPHLICTATALFAMIEHTNELFGEGCAPMMRQVLQVLLPIMLNGAAVRASAPDILSAMPVSYKLHRAGARTGAAAPSGNNNVGFDKDARGLGCGHHPSEYAIRYIHCTMAHDLTQQLAMRRVGVYRMRDKIVLRQHQDRTIFSSIKSVMRPFVQSLFQQWRAVTRRRRALKTAIGSLLVLGSDREVTRRCVRRWLFMSRTVHCGVELAEDMRHDDQSPSNALIKRLAMAAVDNAFTSSGNATCVEAAPMASSAFVPAALRSPRGSLLVARDSQEESLERQAIAPLPNQSRRLSTVIVEDSELEPPAALRLMPLGKQSATSPRSGPGTSNGIPSLQARRVSTVFVNDSDTPSNATPSVPPPLAIFGAAPSSPALPLGTGNSESASTKTGRLGGGPITIGSLAASPSSGRSTLHQTARPPHPIQFPFSPLIHGAAKISTENMFSPMVSPRYNAGHRGSVSQTLPSPQLMGVQAFNSTNPDSLPSGSVREGLSIEPMSFNVSNPAMLNAAFNSTNPSASTRLLGSLRSPSHRLSVSVPGHRFNTSLLAGSNSASPSNSNAATSVGSVFDPKRPSERHRRLAMIATGLQESIDHRNKMLAEFEYTHRAAMEERQEHLDELLETYTKASERVGASFRAVLDYVYPLVPSPLMGNAMILADAAAMSGSMSHNRGDGPMLQDLSFPPPALAAPSNAARSTSVLGGRQPPTDDEAFLLPGQLIPPIDMTQLAIAGSESKKSQQRVREAETAHLFGVVKRHSAANTSVVSSPAKPSKLRPLHAVGQQQGESSSSAAAAQKRSHTMELQEAEADHDRELFKRQERIFNWLMHLAKHDVGSAGARLGTFLNCCCSERTANLTLSVVGRTSHLLPLVRLALMTLAPPSLTHFQLVDLFSEELLAKASTAPPPPPSATSHAEARDSFPLPLRGFKSFGVQQESSVSLRSVGSESIPSAGQATTKQSSETASPTFATFEPPTQQLHTAGSGVGDHDSPVINSVADAAFSFLQRRQSSGVALGITGLGPSPQQRRGSQRRRSSVGFMLDTPRPESLMPELREENETQERRQSERRASVLGGSLQGSSASAAAGGRRRTINPTVGFRAFDSEGAPVTANGSNSAGVSNSGSPFAAALFPADTMVHAEDLNTAARRVSVAMVALQQQQQQHNSTSNGAPHPSIRKRSLATKLDIVTMRAAQFEDANVNETFSQQYRRFSHHPGGAAAVAPTAQKQGNSNRPSPSTSKNVTPAASNLTPSAQSMQQQQGPQQQLPPPPPQNANMLDVSNMNQILRRKSVDLYQNRVMSSILNLEAAALSMVKEHRKGFFHSGMPDPLAVGVSGDGGQDLTTAISFTALGTTDEEREQELRLREEDALLREEEQQMSVISEEVERAIREKEIRQILNGVGNCSDATSVTHLVIKLMNRMYVHHHQGIAVEDAVKGLNAPELEQPSRARIMIKKELDIFADSLFIPHAQQKLSPRNAAGGGGSGPHLPQQTLIRVFPQVLTRHLVLKHKNWRHLVMAALYFTQVGPMCLAFRNVYSGLENRARKPLKSLSPQERRDVLLGKASRVSYLVAASVIPEHDPPPTTPQQMHQLLATRKLRKREQQLDIEEQNANTMYHDAVRDVSLKAFYGIGLTTTAGQLYDQFCAASPDIADASIILPSFMAAKMKIVFGPESSFWRPVTSVRAIHNSAELEEMLTTLAPLGRISAQDLCDRLLNSLDDTDLFFVAMASQEVEDAYTACFPEVSVVFSLYASASYAGAVDEQPNSNPNASASPPPTPKVSYESWMTLNQAMYDVHYSSVVAETIFHTIARRVFNQEAQDAALSQGTTTIFQLQQVLMLAGSGGVLGGGGGGVGASRVSVSTTAAPEDASTSAHKASIRQQEELAKSALENVCLDLDSFCDALSVMASMKFPSPFTPLEQKVTPFVQTLLVPLAGSKSKDIRRKMHVSAGSGVGGAVTKGDLRGGKMLSLDNLSPELRAKIGMIRDKQRNEKGRQRQRLPE